ncbi:MAG: hypothetical protein K8H89_01220 [Flavobacteriales bacterium]|jgi:hypothetical protein|nr:hypothetical protein [Flavobacteriales bacterium]
MKEMKRTWLITALGVLLGAVAGWFYWSQWRCEVGCAITSSPIRSTLYGGFMGGLIVNTFKKEKKTELPNDNQNKN